MQGKKIVELLVGDAIPDAHSDDRRKSEKLRARWGNLSMIVEFLAARLSWWSPKLPLRPLLAVQMHHDFLGVPSYPLPLCCQPWTAPLEFFVVWRSC